MSFGSLLRQSKFVAFKPNTKQTFIKVGQEGGMKRSVNNSCFVIQDFDDVFGLTRTQPTLQHYKYALASRLFAIEEKDKKENPKELKRKTITELSREEFNQVLEQAKAQKEKFRRETEDAPVKRRDPAYLEEYMGILPAVSETQEYPCSLSYLSSSSSSSSSSSLATTTRKVKGRVLNWVKEGYAVGVGGYVCLLPDDRLAFAMMPGWNPNDRQKVYDFWIRDVKFSRDGKPHIKLSLTDPSIKPSADLVFGKKSSSKNRSGKPPVKDVTDELQALLDDLLRDTPNS